MIVWQMINIGTSAFFSLHSLSLPFSLSVGTVVNSILQTWSVHSNLHSNVQNEGATGKGRELNLWPKNPEKPLIKWQWQKIYPYIRYIRRYEYNTHLTAFIMYIIYHRWGIRACEHVSVLQHLVFTCVNESSVWCAGSFDWLVGWFGLVDWVFYGPTVVQI